MKRFAGILGTSLILLTAACGGGDKPPPKTPNGNTGGPAAPPPELSKDDQAKYNAAVDLFASHDKAGDWTPETCAAVAQAFDAVQKSAQALFNEGLAYQRCNDDKNAQAKFQERFPDQRTYISYSEPYFKVHVGDFRTRLEAEKMQNELKAWFSGMFIVTEKVTPKINTE